MRTFFTLILILSFTYSSIAQFSEVRRAGGKNGQWIGEALTGDISGDGKPDIAYRDEDGISWLENNLNGLQTFKAFKNHWIFSTRSSGMAVMDIEGDGDIDIVVARIGIKLCLNNGNHQFSIFSIDTTGSIRSLRCADMDGDGDMDIVVAAKGNYEVTWHENTGTTSFPDHPVSSLPTFLDYFSIAIPTDLDGDGDMDVVASNEGRRRIVWFENDGNQNFSKHILSNHTVFTEHMLTLDLDQDQDMDLLAIVDTSIIWFENNNLSFTPKVLVSFDGVFRIETADIENDGDLDLFVGTDNRKGLFWYENDGNMNFTQRLLGYGGARCHSLAPVDLDGDTDMDLVVTVFNGGVIWYENTTTFVGIPENIQYSDWYVYQNDDRINLRFSQHHPINNRTRVSLTSMSSQVVYDGFPPINDNLIEIPKKDWKPGIYILKWQSAQGQGSTKLIIGRSWRQS